MRKAQRVSAVYLAGFFLIGLLYGCAYDVAAIKQDTTSPTAVALLQFHSDALLVEQFELISVEGPSRGAILYNQALSYIEAGHGAPRRQIFPGPFAVGQFPPGRYALRGVLLRDGGVATRFISLCRGSLEFVAQPGEALYLGNYVIVGNEVRKVADNIELARQDIQTIPGITSPLKTPVMSPARFENPGLFEFGDCKN